MCIRAVCSSSSSSSSPPLFPPVDRHASSLKALRKHARLSVCVAPICLSVCLPSALSACLPALLLPSSLLVWRKIETKKLEISGIDSVVKTTCTGVEMFKKMLDQGQAGDNIGALLRGLKREDVQRGQVCVWCVSVCLLCVCLCVLLSDLLWMSLYSISGG